MTFLLQASYKTWIIAELCKKKNISCHFTHAVLCGNTVCVCVWGCVCACVTACELLPLQLVYHSLQLLAFAILAILIMRLKLFLTPHMCIMASLVCSKQVCVAAQQKRKETPAWSISCWSRASTLSVSSSVVRMDWGQSQTPDGGFCAPGSHGGSGRGQPAGPMGHHRRVQQPAAGGAAGLDPGKH